MSEAGGSGPEGPPPDEDSLTMLDVLQEAQELDDDANAVLGNTDDKHCSYSQGYVKRQPLYSCLTCTSEPERPSGICLACSYHCHESHELIELYTKRNFRCDCGGGRQPNVTCRLTEKTGDNADNQYNQNYSGLYCTCHRPYPDPEDSTPDQMIQCVLCEDWFHGRHLGTAVPSDGEYSEMTCAACVKMHRFLTSYANDPEMAVTTQKTDEASAQDPASAVKAAPTADSPQDTDSASGCKLSRHVADNQKSSAVESAESQPTAVFWREAWRTRLCTCDTCKAMYGDQGVTFLLDEEDTVTWYEQRGARAQDGSPDSYVRGMQALSSMDRVQQVEVVHEYNTLKSELMEYLKKFAENKKVVREEDIKEFFSGLQSRKRQRVEMPHFCR